MIKQILFFKFQEAKRKRDKSPTAQDQVAKAFAENPKPKSRLKANMIAIKSPRKVGNTSWIAVNPNSPQKKGDNRQISKNQEFALTQQFFPAVFLDCQIKKRQTI